MGRQIDLSDAGGSAGRLICSETDGDFGSHIELFDSSHHLASPTTVHDARHDVGFPSSRRSMSEAERRDGDIDVP